VKKTILRNFLEIYSLSDLKKVENPSINLNLVETKDFQLNKFLYKQIGKKHNWLDRLNWSDQNWIQYVSQKNLYTYILKDNEDLVGYFELNLNEEKKEAEIVYLGILQEYYGKKIGAFLLCEAIQKSFSLNSQRVWVHTCSLDHKHALKNYISRGLKIFKTETLKVEIA
tara:strand:- start:1917 stop:2423 length:507 start_codon:yes stop_codon:yes gene_type:complete